MSKHYYRPYDYSNTTEAIRDLILNFKSGLRNEPIKDYDSLTQDEKQTLLLAHLEDQSLNSQYLVQPDRHEKNKLGHSILALFAGVGSVDEFKTALLKCLEKDNRKFLNDFIDQIVNNRANEVKFEMEDCYEEKEELSDEEDYWNADYSRRFHDFNMPF